MASFWARYQLPAGITVGAGVRYIGKQWADDANTERLPSVTLLDAMARADLGAWSTAMKGAYIRLTRIISAIVNIFPAATAPATVTGG